MGIVSIRPSIAMLNDKFCDQWAWATMVRLGFINKRIRQSSARARAAIRFYPDPGVAAAYCAAP
jgi:hypothetical protein